MFVVSLLFSEKQMEEGEKKTKKQKWRAHSDTPAKFSPGYYSTGLYYSPL